MQTSTNPDLAFKVEYGPKLRALRNETRGTREDIQRVDDDKDSYQVKISNKKE